MQPAEPLGFLRYKENTTMTPDEQILVQSLVTLIQEQAALLDALVLHNRALVAQIEALEAIRKAQS